MPFFGSVRVCVGVWVVMMMVVVDQTLFFLPSVAYSLERFLSLASSTCSAVLLSRSRAMMQHQLENARAASRRTKESGLSGWRSQINDEMMFITWGAKPGVHFLSSVACCCSSVVAEAVAHRRAHLDISIHTGRRNAAFGCCRRAEMRQRIAA
ncbi:hypothetical protein P167DRAFT_146233 [Morchella conica CCBAS932]|uniref:Uncharacterized protein n=1 Tax=Morchella conica CCBAS932 TaxID=1392247 RepID=A0A3N4KTN6_9PEZI|nr:hypothetical protein P167DRAFT_146233 [Morchella conica CCBAS932]